MQNCTLNFKFKKWNSTLLTLWFSKHARKTSWSPSGLVPITRAEEPSCQGIKSLGQLRFCSNIYLNFQTASDLLCLSSDQETYSFVSIIDTVASQLTQFSAGLEEEVRQILKDKPEISFKKRLFEDFVKTQYGKYDREVRGVERFDKEALLLIALKQCRNYISPTSLFDAIFCTTGCSSGNFVLSQARH